MTNQNKLIVGAVVVLGAYYLYDRNKKMKASAELKAGADVKAEEVPVQKNDAKSLLEIPREDHSNILKNMVKA